MTKDSITLIQKQAVLDYILSLGWQDTSNGYVLEVIKDADILADEIEKLKTNSQVERN